MWTSSASFRAFQKDNWAFHKAPKLESPKLQRREAGAGKAFSSYLTCRELLQAQFALIYFN
jgi:hypothetical protein